MCALPRTSDRLLQLDHPRHRAGPQSIQACVAAPSSGRGHCSQAGAVPFGTGDAVACDKGYANTKANGHLTLLQGSAQARAYAALNQSNRLA